MAQNVPADIAASNAKKIVYVSCDPATMARDMAKFLQLGYSIDSVVPLDLFPQTYHVECVVLMSRKQDWN